MQAIIIGKDKGGEDIFQESRLLWAGALLFPRVHLNSWASYFINSRAFMKAMDEPRKVRYCLDMAKRAKPDLDDEGLRENYEWLQKMRRKKGKTGPQMKAVIAVEKLMRNLENYVVEYETWLAQSMRLGPLLPLTGTDEDEKPITAWQFNSEDIRSEHTEYFLNNMTVPFCDYNVLPLFDEDIEALAEVRPLGEKWPFGKPSSKPQFLSVPLAQFPPPESLEASEVKLLRSEVMEGTGELMKSLETANEAVRAFGFSKESFAEVKKQWDEHLAPRLPAMQRTLDDSLYISKLKSSTAGDKDYRVHLCLGSCRDVVSIYTAQEIISQETEVYMKRYLSQKINPDSTCLFLYMTPE